MNRRALLLVVEGDGDRDRDLIISICHVPLKFTAPHKAWEAVPGSLRFSSLSLSDMSGRKPVRGVTPADHLVKVGNRETVAHIQTKHYYTEIS